MDTQSTLQKIRREAQAAINAAKTVGEVEALQNSILGKKSELQDILTNLKSLPEDQKKVIGKEANVLKVQLSEQITAKLEKFRDAEFNEKLSSETMDLGLPAIGNPNGLLHPVTKELQLITSIFQRMGFMVVEPKMIDDEYNTFTALNIPEGHPARDMWDTIFVEDGKLLITHTSSMQNRIISGNELPVRAVVPGKCFRNEATDATHEHSFYQLEGVYVDKNIKLTDLIGTLSEFLNQYFEREVPLKIQPTFFPFVEPGLEIMMPRPTEANMNRQGEFNPETTDWMEVIPCGPIHPNVLKEAGVDSEIYSGFAWGLGLERLIMIKRQINDLRYFHSGRIDFLNQF